MDIASLIASLAYFVLREDCSRRLAKSALTYVNETDALVSVNQRRTRQAATVWQSLTTGKELQVQNGLGTDCTIGFSLRCQRVTRLRIGHASDRQNPKSSSDR